MAMARAVSLKIPGLETEVAMANALAGRVVAVGFQSGGPSYEGVTALDVAAYNIFGTRTAPARDFMGQTMTENRDKVKIATARVVDAVRAGAPLEQTLGQLGAFYQTLIQRQIVNGSYAPNKAATIKAKGSSKPLVDTGRVLVPNIRYVVR